jgi:hypothetical protein
VPLPKTSSGKSRNEQYEGNRLHATHGVSSTLPNVKQSNIEVFFLALSEFRLSVILGWQGDSAGQGILYNLHFMYSFGRRECIMLHPDINTLPCC